MDLAFMINKEFDRYLDVLLSDYFINEAKKIPKFRGMVTGTNSWGTITLALRGGIYAYDIGDMAIINQYRAISKGNIDKLAALLKNNLERQGKTVRRLRDSTIPAE
jgi:hypothetical protein